ncbi:phage tail protein [Qipengyuania xiapuensis]|uniref:Phage tail protein n=1 Tax=Qipengyuania xiapuensis TaxID=2867236 RepID=A0ABX8ZUF8_9SPHN|nr:phage tail protein [Qipengyuania xiapuensis]QZD91729.1 phage tail protein [Qipengyuania xiapuensis]
MATIVLSTLGSFLGPLGHLVGTLAGNAIDNELFGPPDREGPRLKELAVSSSSYGNPIAALYGAMRVPGTVIWSTDLQESRSSESNGKGQPKTVTYSYSVSFAVALSSRPIDRIGRIWADGNLLRGAGGDLKSSGTMRVYNGLADQPVDPLLNAKLGDQCPAFRGCAYVVFEDLDLTDFGNRIPALSFEVFADGASDMIEKLVAGSGARADAGTRFPELTGFNHEGGSVRNVIGVVDRIHPLTPKLGEDGLSLAGDPDAASIAIALREPAIWEDGDFGKQSGQSHARANGTDRSFSALRYYDPARDYQPGMQHAGDGNGQVRTYQFPGALTAGNARELASKACALSLGMAETLSWRLAELDPAIEPGSLVTIPDTAGFWKVTAWEWRERGVEVQLARHRTTEPDGTGADAGASWTPLDRLAGETSLRVFETPWDGIGNSSGRKVFAAATSSAPHWHGAALYTVRDGALVETGEIVGTRARMGELVEPLFGSSALRFEAEASITVDLVDPASELHSTTIAGIAQGENRLLIGNEVVQFSQAQPLGDGRWHLTGLLRGRGGTEIEALAGHAQGAPVTLLNAELVPLSEETIGAITSEIAALGLGDPEPVIATLENAGVSLRPPCPVHPRISPGADGSIHLSWRRRARGQWLWPDEVEIPLVEQSESYLIGLGSPDQPVAQWDSNGPGLTIDGDQASALRLQYPGLQFWVRQRGSHALSRALGIGTLD